ncbi:MAG: type II toxin-antitoxin system VapC family toxin [Deltaproteobacteria bacterium]|jgi:predicted nucleic acid-binding protein|nr:type II toxin-antitoxin system VapC family toxin [Deltaproteobacteria bacterium]
MSGKWVLDTNIIIGFVNGAEAATRLIVERGDEELCASVISRVELLSFHSLPPDEERRIRQFLRYVTVIDFDEQVEMATIALRRLTQLKLPDAIIAATAVALGAPLFTFDRRLVALGWPGLRTIIPA